LFRIGIQFVLIPRPVLVLFLKQLVVKKRWTMI